MNHSPTKISLADVSHPTVGVEGAYTPDMVMVVPSNILKVKK